MEELLSKIAHCVEFGKVDKTAPYPPDMKGQEGADELTKQAIEQGIPAETILKEALVIGMDKVGVKFSEKKIFIPQMLMSAKAMNAAIEHLKPFFQSGEVKRKGKFIIATVQGDLHDIGKNLVKMSIEGAGWEVIDLGVDVKAEKVIASIEQNPGAIVGLSALLTTTMANMKNSVADIKAKYPESIVMVGGAPVSQGFCNEIGADFYAPDPQAAVAFLKAK
ncbi:MAG: cobalamin-dependent protein [Bacteroidales bacterium]|nr:cobalamin-dependent protein [Bacteroidales bacterium]MBN2820519.1 cobalamin-dependent protein [Bacteroidales bacterium]